jgi:hypothetical protein
MQSNLQCGELILLNTNNKISWPLHDPVVIGRRGAFCDLVVEGHYVSRVHAEIYRENARYFIKDRSKNGTWMNGYRLPYNEAIPLPNEALLSCGAKSPSNLQFYDSDATLTRPQRLNFDEVQQKFFIDKKPLILTPNETVFLECLYAAQGAIASHQECALAIWHDEDSEGRLTSLHRLASDLRAKLMLYTPEKRDWVLAVNGQGYRLHQDLF